MTTHISLFSNGNVYIFTRNEERKADRAQLEAFDEGVAQKLCQDVVKVVDDQVCVRNTLQFLHNCRLHLNWSPYFSSSQLLTF